jgi:tetratricopeptide (TPR) repeat protein
MFSFLNKEKNIIAKADKLINAKKFDDAISFLENAEKSHPKSIPIKLVLQSVYQIQNELDQAWETLLNALTTYNQSPKKEHDLDQGISEAFHCLAEKFVRNNEKLSRILECATSLIDLQPTNGFLNHYITSMKIIKMFVDHYTTSIKIINMLARKSNPNDELNQAITASAFSTIVKNVRCASTSNACNQSFLSALEPLLCRLLSIMNYTEEAAQISNILQESKELTNPVKKLLKSLNSIEITINNDLPKKKTPPKRPTKRLKRRRPPKRSLTNDNKASNRSGKKASSPPKPRIKKAPPLPPKRNAPPPVPPKRKATKQPNKSAPQLIIDQNTLQDKRDKLKNSSGDQKKNVIKM